MTKSAVGNVRNNFEFHRLAVVMPEVHQDPHAREQLVLVVLDLCDHPAGLVPTAGLVNEVVVPDDRLTLADGIDLCA